MYFSFADAKLYVPGKLQCGHSNSSFLSTLPTEKVFQYGNEKGNDSR